MAIQPPRDFGVRPLSPAALLAHEDEPDDGGPDFGGILDKLLRMLARQQGGADVEIVDDFVPANTVFMEGIGELGL